MVYYYHKLVNKENTQVICEECKSGKRGCVFCKKELASHLNEYLRPIREKKQYLREHPEEVMKVLSEGTKTAHMASEKTMQEVKKAMNINYFEGYDGK